MMELQEFIKETLVQIINGVKDAQEETKDTIAKIVPFSGAFDHVKQGFGSTRLITFDVAVTATEEKTKKAGIGIMVAPLNLGVGGKKETQNAVVSRIKFDVPVSLPASRKA